MYAVHIAVAAVFAVIVSISVIRSVVEMSPRAAGSPGALLPPRECVAEAETLWRVLDEERKEFTRSQPARSVDEEFSHFRVEWLRRFRELEGRCLADAPDRRPLREVFEWSALYRHLFIDPVGHAWRLSPRAPAARKRRRKA